jgi:D-glycero-D-manno-heptose 1,7-bisphosphate phosphatase
MKLIILDRDGTINADRDDYVKSVEEWQPLPGALEAIARLNQGGWHVVVATNQSALARGLFDMAALNAMHAKMHKLLAAVGGKVDAVFFCPHHPNEGCRCRKPEPGLFEQILQRYALDAQEQTVHAVGDTARDLQAAVATKCQPHLVLTGKAQSLRGQLSNGQVLSDAWQGLPSGTRVHDDLAAFAEHLLLIEGRPA